MKKGYLNIFIPNFVFALILSLFLTNNYFVNLLKQNLYLNFIIIILFAIYVHISEKYDSKTVDKYLVTDIESLLIQLIAYFPLYIYYFAY